MKTTSLQIALMGYGKMGKEIETIALERGHTIALKINSSNSTSISKEELKKCDVVIEFSRPVSVLANINKCFEANVPVVVGTTGWYDELNTVKAKCNQLKGALLYASNFSIGVNILFEMNDRLAALMNNRTEYDVVIDEVHHIHKLDKPSGTGITLAEGIIDNLERKKKWITEEKTPSAGDLIIHSYRESEVVGKHTVRYTSAIDEIEIMHNAFSRKGFAQGAVLAAEFITGKKGVFTMSDVLK
ncbi:MAG: 4-hydroxy-tetrahydrodipicolinate reductase [Bacteroidota bacterium]